MQIRIFIRMIKKLEPKGRCISPAEYYDVRFTLNMLYISSYYAHSVDFRVYNFPINARKSTV